MEEWKEYKLSDVCGLVPGFAFKSKDFGTGADIAIKIKDIQPPYVETIDADHVDISNYDLNKLSKFIVHRGEFLLAMTGATIGKIGKYIDEKPAYVNQRVLKFKDVGLVYYPYLYYFLSTEVFQSYIFNHIDSQSAQPNISSNTIGKYAVRVPSLKTQQQIAAILSSLDDKIECNIRINDNFTLSFLLLTCFVLWLLKLRNDNLEQQAQTLFKSWFVDFEPYKDSGFEETEIGRIPKDLLVKRVSEIPHTIETGRRPKGGVGEITSGVPSVGAEHVKGLGNYDYSKTKYITEEYAASLKTGKINGFELLIYKDGGKPGYFIPNYSIFGEGYPFEECFLNEHVFKLDFGDKGYNAFCYFYFWTDYVMNYLNAQGGKAAIPGINRQDIENIQIYAPENELVKRFGDIVLPSIRQILFNCKESRRLAQLRDALLPRLMSGDLKVNEVDCLS